MQQIIRENIELILSQREWSWAAMAIGYFLIALFIRGWFLKPIFRHLGRLDRGVRKQVRKEYFKRSFIGWLFLLLSMACAAILWISTIDLHLRPEQEVLAFAGLASLILAVIFHLGAYAVAGLKVLKEKSQ